MNKIISLTNELKKAVSSGDLDIIDTLLEKGIDQTDLLEAHVANNCFRVEKEVMTKIVGKENEKPTENIPPNKRKSVANVFAVETKEIADSM